MAYKKLVKYRKDLSFPALSIFIKSLKYRKKIIPDKKILPAFEFIYDFGFPLWEKEGNIYNFGDYRLVNPNEIVIIRRNDLRKLAKYCNIDLIFLANIYFATSMLAVNIKNSKNWRLIETFNNELMLPKFRNLQWYIEYYGEKYIILEKRRFLYGYTIKRKN